MRETKREYKFFSFYDFAGIQAHLEAMAARGWMLEAVGTWFWRYRRETPRQVRFAVTYFPQASEFDPRPLEGQQVLADYCAEAGWEPVAQSAQMQIFRNEAADPVPMETDAAVQVENIHRAMRKNYLPSHLLLMVLALFQLGMMAWRLRTDAVTVLTDPTTFFTLPCWLVVLAVCVTESGTYLRWYRRAREAAAAEGRLVPPRSHRGLQTFTLLCLGLGMAVWLLSLGSRRQTVIAFCSIAMMAALIALVNLLKALLKRRGVSAGVNRTVTLGACFVLSFALMGGMVFFLLQMTRSGLLDDHPPAETYVYHNMEWEVYHDPIPLTVQDLTDTDYTAWSTVAGMDRSFFMSRRTFSQDPRMDAVGVPHLRYEIVESAFTPLLDLALRDYLAEGERYSNEELDLFYGWVPEAAEAWQAEQVYRFRRGEDMADTWLVRWPGRVVEIRLGWTPTPGQIAAAAEVLKTA